MGYEMTSYSNNNKTKHAGAMRYQIVAYVLFALLFVSAVIITILILQIFSECGNTQASYQGGQTQSSSSSRDSGLSKGVYADCKDAYDNGIRTSTVTVSTDGARQFEVLCEQDLYGGGWTVIQQRINGNEDFFRNWADYKRGFGYINRKTDFWLGNDNINALTTASSSRLLIVMTYPDGRQKFAEYGRFVIGNENNRYRLQLHNRLRESHGPAAPTAFIRHNGSPFSTRDRDNDASPTRHCAQERRAGWWFNGQHTNCMSCNLNGLYQTWDWKGICWNMLTCKKGTHGFKSDQFIQLQSVRMMIRRDF